MIENRLLSFRLIWLVVKLSFVGRAAELSLLDRLWNSPRATLLILYGRRRVGKTRLLTHWLKKQAGAGLYWVAEPTSSLGQLRSFSQALASFVDPEEPPPERFQLLNLGTRFSSSCTFDQGEKAYPLY